MTTESAPEEPGGSWQLTDDVDRFIDRGGQFLRGDPVLHTVLLSVTDTMRVHGPRAYGDEAPLFGTYEGDDGVVRGTFMWTPPHRLYLGPLTTEATDALARRLADVSPRPHGAGADRATVEAFAQAWGKCTGARATLVMRQRLYRLGDLTPPEPAPPGRARVATEADRELLARWYEEFAAAAGERIAMDPYDWADARLAYGGATLWETPDGTPVALAGATRPVAGQIRVAPVYTPAPLRRRGYAGAATAAVSRAALDAGAAEVLLFTDLANPTSNGLYQRIGYRPVADFAQYDFTG
ncbi:GNAT family N-acetyltransferase [Streptomyces sp. NPDC029674]|uniref:GNAT family N-acetyltransferase n=1 Tax=Streptomyces sp. NPDC029674 TaxID=3365297 RepID=UPI003850ED53